MRYNKIMALFLYILLSFSLISCGGREQQEVPTDSPEQTEHGAEDTKPLLDADATDEDLLEAISDDIHVVTDGDYAKTLDEIRDNTGVYIGQVYQIEGIFKKDGETPYIVRTLVKGKKKTDSGLPLKYLTEEPKEGDWVRITGIVNRGEDDAEPAAVLEVLVAEPLEEHGAAELHVD